MNKNVKGPIVVNWQIQHGSLVFMIGERFQDIYEHSITPLGYRFGQILRHVIPENTKVEDGGMGERLWTRLRRHEQD